MTAVWYPQARAEGLVPDDEPGTGSVTAAPARPWPTVLLSAIGAWMLMPLLGLLLIALFGQALRRGPLLYGLGAGLVLAAVLLLRRRRIGVLLEQLTVPMLLLGALALSYAWLRDLDDSAAQALILLLDVALIAVVRQPWLRMMLGAGAFGVLALLLNKQFHSGLLGGIEWTVHVLLALALLLSALQVRLGRQGRTARWAAWMEAPLCGAWVMVLALTALGAARFPDVQKMFSVSAASAVAAATVSGVLVLAGGAWLHRRWGVPRGMSELAFWAPVLVLAVVGAFIPWLGLPLLVTAVMAASRRWRLAVLAGVTALWVVGQFYYGLAWPLAVKAVVLIVAGGALVGWSRWMAWTERSGAEALAAGAASAPVPVSAAAVTAPVPVSTAAVTAPVPVSTATVTAQDTPASVAVVPSEAASRDVAEAQPLTPARRWAVLAGGLALLVVVNVAIFQRERLIETGRPVFVQLAPVDPRSLMQGDYMRLAYALPPPPKLRYPWGERPRVAVRVDERGIAGHAVMLKSDQAVPAGHQVLELTPTGRGWTLVSDAWFFREGEGERWARARYGEFRVQPDGRALLVGLVGEDLKPL